MVEMTPAVTPDIHERERSLDWMTALSPVLLMALCYFRWQAAGLVLLAVAGYLTAAALLQWAGLLSCRTAPAAVTGMLTAFCLPATAPLWCAALAGAFAAVVAVLPGLLSRRFPGHPVSRPLLCPALCGYLAVRFLFPGAVTAFVMPDQWVAMDAVTSATPLCGLWDPTLAISQTRLFLGLHPGGIGEGCIPVLLMAALYLLLRRRLRLIAPGVMLATVSLFSWIGWGSPLYGILAGGTMLAALLLADRTFAPEDMASQAVAGVIAGVVTVLLRGLAHRDGSAVGVLVACLLSPLYPPVLRLVVRGIGWLVAYLREKIAKTKNNS